MALTFNFRFERLSAADACLRYMDSVLSYTQPLKESENNIKYRYVRYDKRKLYSSFSEAGLFYVNGMCSS